MFIKLKLVFRTKQRDCHKLSVIFLMSEWERMLFVKRQLQSIKWKNTKIHCKITGGVPRHICPFAGIKTTLAFLVNPFNVNVLSVTGVQFANRVCYKLVCCRNETDRNARDLVLKNFSQCHSTVDFWRQVPESKYPKFETPVYDSFLYLARHIAVNFHSL